VILFLERVVSLVIVVLTQDHSECGDETLGVTSARAKSADAAVLYYTANYIAIICIVILMTIILALFFCFPLIFGAR